MTKDEALKLALEALLNLEVDANAIFNYPSNETSQDVRDVINWYAASIRTFTLDEVEPPDHMDALRFADEIDPLTRKANPDNLTLSCAAKVLRNLAQPEPLTPEDMAYRSGGLDHPEQMARLGWQCVECPACGSEGARAFPKPEEQQSCDKQEPVAWLRADGMKAMEADEKESWIEAKRPELVTEYTIPLYTSPPQRQPLTDDEIRQLWDDHTVPVFGKIGINPIVFARAIEAAHGIGDKT